MNLVLSTTYSNTRLLVNVQSLEEARKYFESWRDAQRLGNSEFGADCGVVLEDGREIAFISYNGRVWRGRDAAGLKVELLPTGIGDCVVPLTLKKRRIEMPFVKHADQSYSYHRGSEVASTAVEMLPAIGQRVVVRCESLRVVCIVKDCRRVWNRNDLLVVPVEGTGEQWVSLERVTAVFPQEGLSR